jgi:serine/threonine protein kinase
MAPEIVKEQPYKLSIDVWSLGILLYELIHGYSPFRATKVKGEDNYEEVFKNILNHNYSIDKNISNDCEDLIDSKYHCISLYVILVYRIANEEL